MSVCRSCQTLNSQHALRDVTVGKPVTALDPAVTAEDDLNVPVEVCAVCGGPLLSAETPPPQV